MNEKPEMTRVLLVEDSQGVARALHRALGLHQTSNFHVETCETGEDALERLFETSFNLLISDLRLPGINGLELLRRANQLRPALRSILITAYGSPEIEREARELANAYLPKPFRLHDLIRLVERVMREPMTPAPETGTPPPPPAITEKPPKRKSAHLIVIASDFDGTLTQTGEMPTQIWTTLRRAKMAGLPIILVTGRTLNAILSKGPFSELCEAIVAENGAVIYFPKRDAILLPFGRVSNDVIQRLEMMEVPIERGLAIVATYTPHDSNVLKAMRQTRSAGNIEYNREAVMLLPQGATKGMGLRYALQELGYSPRNVVACGDAENDRSLFEIAELSVAVANARPLLKEVADTVLPQPDGEGVQALIEQLIAGEAPPRAPRPERRLVLGERMSGMPVHIDPFKLVEQNIGIFGASASGKSWLAGLVAEELLKQGYQVAIIDPEGDYRGLSTSPHTLLLGGPDKRLPMVSDVINFCEWNTLSLVLDLSLYTLEERVDYLIEFLNAMRGLRTRRGRPHCFLVDEIQSFCPATGERLTDLFLDAMAWGGFGLISYRPSHIAPALMEKLDHWLLTRLSLPSELEMLEPELTQYNGGAAAMAALPSLPRGQAYLCLNRPGGPSARSDGKEDDTLIKFRVGPRSIPHIRHLHKYLRAPLPEHKRFYFHTKEEEYLHRTAANLWEFRKALAEVPLASIQHHLARGDFQQWVQNVLHDDELARRIRKISHHKLTGEPLRRALLETVINRYEELERLA